MSRAFFIVGPTATGKSELAADVARETGAEIVSADAFQIYRGLDLLTAKPDHSTLAKAPHHLIGTMALSEEMNAEKYRRAASRAVEEINSRGNLAIVVGGSGLYIRALTHGLAPLADADPKLREQLTAMSIDHLRVRLAELDPETARKIDMNNRRRLIRALEICLLTGRPASTQRKQWAVAASLCEARRVGVTPRREDASHSEAATGVFVYRDREELYERINERVKAMFERGVIEEVDAAGAMSATASQMIGLREIRELLDGRISRLQCIAAIQQATRRYAKRQLTWFRRQTSFWPLNLSLLTHNEARILLRMRSGLRRGFRGAF
ncbi:MAG TPA: tRNA (adenosine(37)-N6)-dimethylallyltransferase MiaA [Candidatus Udaeobacter sp.]|jgi:tRNA dimethylallyltransferase|nr:tRNA (adenosine(37)-N6)-dimethylallyltransferase MiaA [Candidatus Udaeobacter sp.]